MMSLSDIHQSLWPHSNNISDPFFMEDEHCVDEYSFSPPFFATEDSHEISSSMQQYLDQSIFSDECMEFPQLVDHEVQENCSIEDFQINFDEFDHIFKDVVDHHDIAMDVCHASMDSASMQIPSLLECMEINSERCLLHLLVAYAEAIDNQETLLSRVIIEHIIKKVNPVGGILERVLYYMFRHLDKESDYFIKESLNNFYAAFKAFYQIFPYGKFAHFVANSAIIENMPSDVDIIHVLDFDIGEGIQISSFLEEIKRYRCKEVRVTSVRFGEDGESFNHSIWNFEETKIRICDQARSCGINMKVEEVEFMDLECKMKSIEKECRGRKSWYVFNCMVGLPHMGRIRSKNCVFEFLKVAENFLQNVTNCETMFNKGIITYGDGDTWYYSINMTTSGDYTRFLDSNVARFRAFLESMEFSFPYHLGEARVALESLFAEPYFSSITLERKWEENRQYGGDQQVGLILGMEGLRLSEKCILEAIEMVNEGDNNSPYGVRFVSEKKNEMVMDWRGTPLVRVCCWKR